MEKLKTEEEKLDEIVQVANTIIQDSFNLSSLPFTLVEIINQFLDYLSTSKSNEDKELVLLALKRILTQLLEPHNNPDSIIRILEPLLLNSSFSIRNKAAECILLCLDASSMIDLQPRLASLFQTLHLALTSVNTNLAFNASSSVSLQFVSTCLQIYKSLLEKMSVLTSDLVTMIVEHLSKWIYYKPGLGGSREVLARGRSSSGASLAFGVMGSFLPPSPSKKRDSSIRSSSRGHNSESEDDNAYFTDRKYSSVDVRLKALLVLETIATIDSKLLFGHWNHFFSDSPYLKSPRTLLALIESDPSFSVRLRACQTLEAMLNGSSSYLAIAEDRPTKASFTSLSSRLGETVIELHLKLSALISSPSSSSSSSELRIAMIKVASVLAKNSPYLRMKRTIASPLVRSILHFTENEDDELSFVAATTLTNIVDCVYSSSIPTSQTLELDSIGTFVIQILKQSKLATVKSASWNLLASTLSRGSTLNLEPALLILQAEAPLLTTIELEDRISFIAAVFRTAGSVDLVPCSQVLLAITESAIKSTRPLVRVLACGILASVEFSRINLEFDIYAKVLNLAEDEDSSVRSAACRSLGLLVKSIYIPINDENLKSVIERLEICCEEIETKGTASWALANSCDHLTDLTSSKLDITNLIEISLKLTSSTNSEKIQTNGIRTLGSLLRISTFSKESESNVFRMVSALCEGNRIGKSAKLRWNSAFAIGNALMGKSFSTPSQLISQRVKLIQSLASNLTEDGNFKVRIQSVNSLLNLNSFELFLKENAEDDEFEEVRGRVRLAIEKVRVEEEGGTISKEREHHNQLVEKLHKCNDHLNSLSIKPQKQ